MNLLGSITWLVRAQSSWFSRSVAGLETSTIPRFIECTVRKELFWDKRLREDQNLMFKGDFFRETKYPQREG